MAMTMSMTMTMTVVVRMSIGLALWLGGELLLLQIALQEILDRQGSQFGGARQRWRWSSWSGGVALAVGFHKVTIPDAVTSLEGGAGFILLVVMDIRVHGLLDEIHEKEAAAHE